MSFLKVDNLYKSFGSTKVLQGIDFNLFPKERLALVGKSGSGKTTILRSIAGLEIPDKGSIIIGENTVNSESKFTVPEKRNIGYVFQNHSLFPHLSVLENITFGLKTMSNKEKNDIAYNYLSLLQLGTKANNYPHELSGGEKQRISIVRTLAFKPSLLLLDEPFSNLDKDTKEDLKAELKQILDLEAIPTILITHDPIDSFDLADRVILLENGIIAAMGEPEELYKQPQDEYSARNFSSSNIIILDDDNSTFFEALGLKSEKAIISPLAIVRTEGGIPAKVLSHRFLGEGYYVYLKCLGANIKMYSTEKIEAEQITVSIDISSIKSV